MESALPIFDADNPINKPTYMAIANANKYECIYIITYIHIYIKKNEHELFTKLVSTY